MNRFEGPFSGGKLARLRYRDGEYDVLVPGNYVLCAVTGQAIALEELRYWSVDRQEAYASPQASLARHRELTED